LHLTCPSEAVVTASLKLTEQKPPPAAAAAARHRLKGEITGALSSWITYIFLEIGVGCTWMRCNFAARIVPFSHDPAVRAADVAVAFWILQVVSYTWPGWLARESAQASGVKFLGCRRSGHR
jgi:hypothetical protein